MYNFSTDQLCAMSLLFGYVLGSAFQYKNFKERLDDLKNDPNKRHVINELSASYNRIYNHRVIVRSSKFGGVIFDDVEEVGYFEHIKDAKQFYKQMTALYQIKEGYTYVPDQYTGKVLEYTTMNFISPDQKKHIRIELTDIH